MILSEATECVIKAAFRVHTALGPGLLESACEACLAHELPPMGMRVERQKALPVVCDGVRFNGGLRLDLLVEDTAIVERKAVEAPQEIHKAQVITHLKLRGKPTGLLLNFNVVGLRDGIRRLVNPRTEKAGDPNLPPLTSVPSDTSL